MKNGINNTSHCHPELDSGSPVCFKLKKAAMFGLDARIALSIFAALSIITGVALYGAMKEAKVVAIITEMDNIDKAVTEYYLDTGSYPEIVTTQSAGRIQMEELITSVKHGWKGPYIGFVDRGTEQDGVLTSSLYEQVFIYRNKDGDWSNASGSDSKCLSTSISCSIYSCYAFVSDDFNKALDLKIDGIVGPDKGNFRWGSSLTCKKGMSYPTILAPSS